MRGKNRPNGKPLNMRKPNVKNKKRWIEGKQRPIDRQKPTD
jgi:hypothetical protein